MVTFNREYLLEDAKQTALGLARAGYRAPRKRSFRVLGESGYATFRSNLLMMVFVCLIAGFMPISQLGEMTSIGTLFAFLAGFGDVITGPAWSDDGGYADRNNTATLRLELDDLLAFLRETGHDPMIVDLPVPADGQND